MPSDILSFIGALLAAISVLIPFIITWYEKRSHLQKTNYYIELIKIREKLDCELEEKHEQNILDNLAALKNKINEDILKASFKRANVKPFIWVLVIEILLVISMLKTKYSEEFSKIIEGNSSVSGVPFFEGIFRYPSTRLMLLMLCIGVSVYFSLAVIGKAKALNKNVYVLNLSLYAAFHVLIVVFGTLGALLLLFLDKYVLYF